MPSRNFNQIISESDIADCLRQGLQAMGANSQKVTVSNTRKIEGSIDIDGCLQPQFPQAPRWDYIVGYKGKAYFIEVHPATQGEVKSMIRKAEWIRQWVDQHLKDLNHLKTEPFIWVASGKVGFLKTSNKARELATAKISFPCRIAKVT